MEFAVPPPKIEDKFLSAVEPRKVPKLLSMSKYGIESIQYLLIS
jgi:hypothetical protein